MPESVSVPAPCLVNDRVFAVPLAMTPAKLVAEVWLTVTAVVAAPALLSVSVPPVPAREVKVEE